MSPWATFTLWFVGFNLLFHIVLILVAIVGGFFDLKAMLKGLRESEVDEMDDGRVSG